MAADVSRRDGSGSAEAFDALASALEVQGATRAKMMGRPMLRIDGRMFACLEGDVLGLRLGAGTADYTQAMAVPGAAMFSPGDKGRVFRDWVAVPIGSAAEWEQLAVAAMAFAEGEDVASASRHRARPS